MKHIFLPTLILSIAFCGTLAAQETDEGTAPEAPNAVAENSGAALLDQATEAKIRATSILHLTQVIDLCQRAKQAGLTGENLRYCNQLLASTQLQRGLVFAQQLLNPQTVRPSDWQVLRQRVLSDLEEAVTIIKDQPVAYLRIAQLNLMPDGDVDRAKEALKLTIQNAGNEPELQVLAARLLTEIEPEAVTRETVLSDVVQDGNPHIALLYALTLLELDRRDDAINVLRQLIDDQSGDTDLQDRVMMALLEADEPLLAMSVLETMREKADDERKTEIDLMKANMLNALEQHEEALVLLNTLEETVLDKADVTIILLLRRSRTHIALDNLDEALKDIEAAGLLRPNIPFILEQKYLILIELGNYTDALAVAKSLQAIGESVENYYREYNALKELEKYDEAAAVIKALREKYPDLEQQWLVLLVDLYTKQKAFDKALALVEEQLENAPDELRWILVKSSVFSTQKEWDKAIDWLESQLQKTPDSSVLNLALLEVLYDKKSFRTAKERLRPLMEKEPKNMRLISFDSQLSISLGLHAEAIEALEKVTEVDPEDFTSINNLAWILATSPIDSVRDGARAVELAEKAAELSRRKEAFVLSTLAAAYAEVGDFEKAREWSKISVEVAKKERGKTEERRKELLEHLQKEWECFSQDKPFREMMNEEE
ncbi:MAG: tetratricopeptide repeat protein [Planctomycetaceae bacterium]|nr:tetratricopeptide repeat protein [Planctomycetaceae bacterium]